MDSPVVIAVDGSPAAKEATSVGLELAHARGCGVLFVHFSELAATLIDNNPEQGPEQSTVLKADAVLGEAAESAKRRDVAFDLVIADEQGAGDIAAAIDGIAESRAASTIVVGTRARSAFAEAALGSVSHALLRIAHVPVVVARPARGHEPRKDDEIAG